MVNLNIPAKYQKRTGLYVYCNKCKSYSNKKEGCLKKSPTCKHPPDRQVYKIKVHVRGTKNKCKILTLKTRDIQEVEKKRIEFIELLKSNNYKLTQTLTTDKSNPNRGFLLYQMDRFIKFKKNGGFYAHEAVKRSEKSTVNDYMRNFRYFLQSLNGFADIQRLRVDEVNGAHVEKFHFFILKKSDQQKTYNNIMGQLKSFFNHLISYEKFDIENPFNAVTIPSTPSNSVSFTKEEFDNILSLTNKENGYDANEKRNWFRGWLPTAFKLGAFSCLRLGELVNLKYSDIREEDGFLVLMAENQKVNKLFGEKDESKKRIKRIRVINEMMKVLNEECDFERNKGSDQYIIAPDTTRSTVKDVIGKGFTHFKRVAKVDDAKCFMHLRTKFISRTQMQYGDINLTKTVSDHSNESVVRKHYIAQMDVAKKMEDFYVFTPPDELEK